MSRAKPTRRIARENAMQMLYQAEMNPALDRDAAKQYFKEQMRFKELEAFALGLFDGVQANRPAIDERLERLSENWRVGRMANVDRAILRLATFEICYSDCPPKVAINEALEICKRYSDTDSPPYVNGLLDKILQQHSGIPTAPEPTLTTEPPPQIEPTPPIEPPAPTATTPPDEDSHS